MNKTNEENTFEVDIRFEDLADSGLDKIDEELQRVIGFSIAELEDEEETILLKLLFFMDEEGKVRHQYHPTPDAPDPYDEGFDVIDDDVDYGEIEPDLDTITADISWEDITPATKQTIREKILAYFGKRRYVFDEQSYIGQARLDISNYIDG